eukprot:67049_1
MSREKRLAELAAEGKLVKRRKARNLTVEYLGTLPKPQQLLSEEEDHVSLESTCGCLSPNINKLKAIQFADLHYVMEKGAGLVCRICLRLFGSQNAVKCHLKTCKMRINENLPCETWNSGKYCDARICNTTEFAHYCKKCDNPMHCAKHCMLSDLIPRLSSRLFPPVGMSYQEYVNNK